MGVCQKRAGCVSVCMLVVVCMCMFLLVCVSSFKGQSKHPLPPGRKNRNGTCHLVIAQPCSGFTLGWKRSGTAPCSVTWYQVDRLHHVDKKSTNSCNMLKHTVTILGETVFFDLKTRHCSWVRCVFPSCSCCKEVQALGFNPAEGSTNEQPYLFTVHSTLCLSPVNSGQAVWMFVKLAAEVFLVLI